MSEIERLIGLLEERTDDFRGFAVDAAKAEAAHKKGYALALLNATDGPVAQREATASLSVDDLFLTRRCAEAVRDSCLEAMRSLRAQISALQSLMRFEGDQT